MPPQRFTVPDAAVLPFRKARYNADQVVSELLAASQGEAAANEVASIKATS